MSGTRRGGATPVFEVGYHPRKKKIMFFRTRQCMRLHHLGCENIHKWEKGCVFGHGHKFWKKEIMKNLRKEHACKNIFEGLFLYLVNSGLGCVLKVILQGLCTA